ncbi:hypothetical protein OG771_39430 [Streptomyces anulatus]|nr:MULTISPECIES: hypothetical protein [Streptomyces]EHM25669.1 cellulose-binding protein [Streptomyces sp. W007]WTD23108.1 hypothetical protein OH737_00500 [Streptomyces anulatus]
MHGDGDDRWSAGNGGPEPSFEDVEDVNGLRPLAEGLQPEVRELACAMRGLFKATQKSLRQFAVYHHFAPGTVSRYLGGRRIPEKNFVDALLKSACKAHGVELTPDVQAYTYRLHREALLAQQPGRYRLQMASDKLEEAILEKEQAELDIRALRLSVSDQKRELSRLERQQREIERSATEDRARSAAEIEIYRGQQRDLETQCDELREEIDRLEAELKQAEHERDDAWVLCLELEEQLASAEEDAEREELKELVEETRREMIEASMVAEERLVDLQRAVEEAGSLRDQATRDAQAKREEADALLEESQARAAQAVVDFDTNFTKHREKAERDLASRQAKAEKRLDAIDYRIWQLRMEEEKLRTHAERPAESLEPQPPYLRFCGAYDGLAELDSLPKLPEV